MEFVSFVLVILASIPSLQCQTVPTKYGTAVCNGSRIDSIFNPSQIDTINGDNFDTVSSDTDINIIGGVSPSTGSVDSIFGAAVRPDTQDVYILFETSSDAFNRYLGILDTPDLVLNLGAVNFFTDIATWGALTFDCSGNLYGVDRREGNIYTISYEGTIGFTLENTANPAAACGTGSSNCNEVISFNWDDGLIYRISDAESTISQPRQRVLFTTSPGTNTSTQVATDFGANVCPVSAAITSLEYIGNDLFLIGCQGTGNLNRIALLDVSSVPTITDLEGTDVLTAPIDLNALGTFAPLSIIPYDSTGSVCPAVCAVPTEAPTRAPTNNPSANPSRSPTNIPTASPSRMPTGNPTRAPSNNPSGSPTRAPTNIPTASPSRMPSNNPSGSPSRSPTNIPTGSPTNNPSGNPTASPSRTPSSNPSRAPTNNPSGSPTRAPTNMPTDNPSRAPTDNPTSNPPGNPTRAPTNIPTASPSLMPSNNPSRSPTNNPTGIPSRAPTNNPSRSPVTPSPTAPTPSPTTPTPTTPSPTTTTSSSTSTTDSSDSDSDSDSDGISSDSDGLSSDSDDSGDSDDDDIMLPASHFSDDDDDDDDGNDDVSDDADINPESIEVADDDNDGDSDDDDNDADDAMAMFKTEDVEKGQLDVENVGQEAKYNLVLNLNKTSWISLWAILGLFATVNALLFWCFYRKDARFQNDNLFDEEQQV